MISEEIVSSQEVEESVEEGSAVEEEEIANHLESPPSQPPARKYKN